MPILSTLFSFRGRINRKTFWLGGILRMYVIGLARGAFLPYVVLSKANDVASGLMLRVLVLALLALYVYMWYAALAKRCHDVGKSGWLSLLTLIPIVGFVFFLWLGLSRGEPYANPHGTSPSLTRLPESADVPE